ncbi:MAG: hypothetical protein ACYC3N_10905 [Halothiobacillus sp.]
MTSPTHKMLDHLTQAVNELIASHHALAQLLAHPDHPESGHALDEIVTAIRLGNARLEAAEQQRHAWLAQQTQPTNMQQALADADQHEHTQYLVAWRRLQPPIESLSTLMQQHHMILGRLGFFIQERVNLLTNAPDARDTAVYAATGKTEHTTDRRRSLGDA